MDIESAVIEYFGVIDFVAEKIGETEEKTPDFLVYDNTTRFLVELKTKFPSEIEIAERRLALDSRQFHNIQEKIVRNNTLSGITHNAAEQLRRYGTDDLFRVVFLLTVGHLAEPRFAQFRASLYGSTTIVDFQKGVAHTCYFFYESDFYRNRDTLDAAIVSTQQERALFLNPYSPRFDQLKTCSLCDKFDGAVVNPLEQEKKGDAYFVDGNVDRRNEDDVLIYLKEKYHSPTLVKIDMNFLSGTTQFPADSK